MTLSEGGPPAEREGPPSTGKAVVRVGALRRGLERLIALPSPLAVRVALDGDRLVCTEHDAAEGWWSSISVRARRAGRPASADEPAVTVPRMVVREVVALESLSRDDVAECTVEVVDGAELRLDTFSVPASRSTPPIEPPPRFDDAEPLVDEVVIPDEQFRHSEPARLTVGRPGQRETIEFSGAALDRFVARDIHRGRLVGAGAHRYLVGATDRAGSEPLVLVARAHPGSS